MSETVTADQTARRAARKGSINRLDPEGTTADAETKQAAREPSRQPAPHGRAEALDRDGNPIYRKRDNTEDKFYVPQDLKEDGWDYQWNCYSVLGEQNMSAQINDAENGWRPVPADRPGFAGRFMPEGHGGAIIRDGLMLCERPMALSRESRHEDRMNANAQRRHNRQQFGLPTVPDGFDDNHASIAKFGKGGKPGVRTALEGAPTASGRYQMEIDD